MKKKFAFFSSLSVAIAVICAANQASAQVTSTGNGTTESEIKNRFNFIDKEGYIKSVQETTANVFTVQTLFKSLSLNETEYTYVAYVQNNEILNLFTAPNINSSTNSTVEPQKLKVYQIEGEWIQVHTWLGPKWIRNINGVVSEIQVSPYRKQLNLKERTLLHEFPSEETKRNDSIAPQIVQVVAKTGNGWFKVKTWVGEKWVYNPLGEFQEIPEKSSIILPKPTLIKGIVTATDLNVRSLPSTSGTILGKLPEYAEVTVQEVKSNWATIQYNNQTAYVSATYLSLYKEIQPETSMYKEGKMLIKNQSRLKLYSKPSEETYMNATVDSQILTALKRVDTYWYEINTWLGPMFVNLEELTSGEVTDVIEKTKGTVVLTKTTNVYNEPFSSNNVEKTIPAQTVNYVAKTQDYYLIETSEGTKWIKSEEANYPVIDKNSPEVSYSSFKLVTSNGIKYYRDLDSVKTAFLNSTDSNAYVTVEGVVVDMKSGFARSNKVANLYNTSGSKATYVDTNTEMDVSKITEDKVYITYAGKEGFIAKTDTVLVPFAKGENRSSFRKDDRGKLIHRIYKGNSSYFDLEVGNAPNHLTVGQHYFTYNPKQIGGQDSAQYFMYMPVRIPATYTAEELDNFIRANVPDSPLIGSGKYFVAAANKYKLNVGYFLAHAIHESAWGKSQIARDKNNLFGFKAVDSNPYDGAASFATLEEGINYCAEYISKNYVNTANWKYNGGFVGDKAEGMNVYYASDAYWGEKIAAYMNRIDAMYGNREKNKYPLGKIAPNVNVYTMSNNSPVYAKKLNLGTYALKLSEVQTSQGAFYRITSDDEVYNNQLYIKADDFKIIKTY